MPGTTAELVRPVQSSQVSAGRRVQVFGFLIWAVTALGGVWFSLAVAGCAGTVCPAGYPAWAGSIAVFAVAASGPLLMRLGAVLSRIERRLHPNYPPSTWQQNLDLGSIVVASVGSLFGAPWVFWRDATSGHPHLWLLPLLLAWTAICAVLAWAWCWRLLTAAHREYRQQKRGGSASD